MKVLNYNRGHAALLLTAMLFGLAFIFQRHAAQATTALWFNAWRFSIATLFLGACWFVLQQLRPRASHGRFPLFGIVGGLLMFGGMMAQQWGLAHTTAGKSGFLTGLYVVLVPVVGLLFGMRAGKATVAAVILAAIGLYCFAGIRSDSAALNWNIGDSVTLIGTVCWTLQVLWTGLAVRHCDILAFSVMQIGTVAVLSIIGVLSQSGISGVLDFELLHFTAWDLAFTGIGSSALAFFMQSVGQCRVPAAHAAIILSLEAVFALLFGWLFLSELVTPLMLLGSGFMLSAMLVAQYDEVADNPSFDADK
ncbi:DMT family transporter [Cardiobacteriaceae bacterium TAE3-ERU3]|nr:DMT family transporter [Cardiobacteriaceae bacterium TAE3-ERU3]